MVVSEFVVVVVASETVVIIIPVVGISYISHVGPDHGDSHMHKKVLLPLTHVPLFKHGFGEQLPIP